MIKNILIFKLLVATAILTGCAGLPQQDFNSEVNKHVKVIGVVKPATPKEFNIFYYNHPGLQFGLIGGLAAAAEMSSKTTEYNTVVKSHSFDAKQYFLDQMQESFKASGYQLVVLPGDGNKEAEFMSRYPDAAVDAYLDSYYLSLGYVAGSPAADYKATVRMAVRLVDKNSKALLYANIISTGESFGVPGETSYIGNDPEFIYSNYDSLLSAPEQTMQGLKKSIDKLVKHLAEQLSVSRSGGEAISMSQITSDN